MYLKLKSGKRIYPRDYSVDYILEERLKDKNISLNKKERIKRRYHEQRMYESMSESKNMIKGIWATSPLAFGSLYGFKSWVSSCGDELPMEVIYVLSSVYVGVPTILEGINYLTTKQKYNKSKKISENLKAGGLEII